MRPSVDARHVPVACPMARENGGSAAVAGGQPRPAWTCKGAGPSLVLGDLLSSRPSRNRGETMGQSSMQDVGSCAGQRASRPWMPTPCKTVGSAYVGSNPTPATTCENCLLAAEIRPRARLLLVTLCITTCHCASICCGVHGRIADGDGRPSGRLIPDLVSAAGPCVHARVARPAPCVPGGYGEVGRRAA